MCRNIYKLKKTIHLNNFLDLNYFKQSCCIFISNTIVKNKEFYNGLKKTLIALSNDNVYLSIYLINIDDFEDPDKLYSTLDKTKLHYMMFFRKTKMEEFDSDIFNFIPLITSKIITINDNYKEWLSKKNNTTSEKQQVKEEITEDIKEKEDIDDETTESEDSDESLIELRQELEKKKKLLENL
jgi:hypothetical protein